jgi:DNA polymerase-1
MAAQILRISYEDAWARKDDPEIKNARSLAKIANFGYPGGLGPTSFVDYARQYGQTITLDASFKLKATWLANWPEMEYYFAFVNAKVGRGYGSKGSVEQFISKRVRGHVGFCDCCNGFFQGLAADGAKRAVYRLCKAVYAPALDVRFKGLSNVLPLAFVHDEIISEVLRFEAHAVSLRMAELMCEAMSEFIPDIPITAKPVLMSVWSKAAHDVRNDKGELIPWTPDHKCAPCDKWRASLAA